jgi:mono/diheme cytochrome c family protein
MLVVLIAVLGCGANDAVRFPPNGLAMAEQAVDVEQRQQVDELLTELFGTPDTPRLPDQLTGLLDMEKLQQASGEVASDEPGQTRGLYQRHCVVCHGLSGDGRGPTALYQSPYPRDFQQGVFKYKSTYRDAPPTDDDLKATLLRGAPGTAMPSFALLPAEEVEALVDYVKFLSIRGELEEALARRLGEGGAEIQPTQALALAELLPPIIRRWEQANGSVVPLPEPGLPNSEAEQAEWVEAGRALFHDTIRANCVKCHGEGGRGGVAIDEAGANDYDDWNKRALAFMEATDRLAAATENLRQRVVETDEQRREFLEQELDTNQRDLDARREVEQTLLPPRAAMARRLVPGALQGEAEPSDLFRRVHQGIAGTPMPAVGATTSTAQGALSDEEVWRLVAYVNGLSAEPSTTGAPAHE